jgi:hypothetical protein
MSELIEEIIERCNTEEKRKSFSVNDFFNSKKKDLIEKLVVFFSLKNTEGEKFKFPTISGKIAEIELDINSGLLFKCIGAFKGIYIYLGQGTFSYNKRFPAFYIMNEKGCNYWETINDVQSSIQRGIAVTFEKQYLKNVQEKTPKVELLNFGDLLQKYQKESLKTDPILVSSMEILSDAVILCRDGNVNIVRFLFAKDSDFFLNLFRYNPQVREFKMLNYDKFVVQTYLDYHLYLNGVVKIDMEKISSDILQIIEFGFYIQDIHFTREMYNIVSYECDNETLEKLNKDVKNFLPFDLYKSKDNK